MKDKTAQQKKKPALQHKHITKKPAPVKVKVKRPRPTAKGRARKITLEKPVEVFGLHSLILPKGAHKRKKLLGRGPSSGHGKTSTRGSKGQTSRAGRHFYLGFEGGQTPIIRRIPKRGFTSVFKKEYQIVNLNDLSRIKEPAITLELLEQKGLIKHKEKLVKILGEGEIKNPVNISAHAFSKSAAEKIKACGGTVEIVKIA